MNFKQKIKAYQQNGDRTIINDIMQAVETDFLRNSSRERVKDGTESGGIRIRLADHHEYIAYRIKAMQELILRHYRTEFEVAPAMINEFQRLLSLIYIDFGIQFKATIYDHDPWMYWFNLTPELFDELERKKSKIKRSLGADDYKVFCYLFGYFREKVNDAQVKVNKRRQEIQETAVKALEYALKYVDTEKSEREIVKYINKTFSCKLSDDEIRRNGLRRIRRDKINYVVKPYFPRDNCRVIFGTSKVNISRLNKSQRKFVDDICALIDHDRQLNDFSGYTTDTDGEARIRRKYIADKLGLREDLVRQRIHRIIKMSQN